VSPVRYELVYYIPEDGILYGHFLKTPRFYIALTKNKLLLDLQCSEKMSTVYLKKASSGTWSYGRLVKLESSEERMASRFRTHDSKRRDTSAFV
jgi:hypothetical protein